MIGVSLALHAVTVKLNYTVLTNRARDTILRYSWVKIYEVLRLAAARGRT